MIAVSNEYKRQLIAGNRNYLIKVDTYLAGNISGTPDFTLTNENIWDNGIVLDNAISNDNSFDIGDAIIGSLKIVINNINGDFSQYDFYDATCWLWLGVTGDEDLGGNQIYYRIGCYNVDKPSYNGSLITLECLDNMTWFDNPFSEVTGISYPTTAGVIIYEICNYVGVTLGTPSFPNYTTPITVEPEETLNCREVLQYIAQMCCCYCKINTAGELVLGWYNKYDIINIHDIDGGSYHTATTPYSDGDNVDGGAFMTGGDNLDGGTFADLMSGAFLSHNFQIDVDTDSVVVTGCRVVNNTSEEDAYDELWVDSTLELTHERYVLVIENNPFITSSNASTIANTVGSILAGLPIRGFRATSLNDISYETGDMVTIYDFRGNFYRTWITHFTFTTNNSERFSCGVESLRERRETRFSGEVKTLAEANKNASDSLSAYDSAVKQMNELAQNSLGYNKYETISNGATLTYLYSGANIDLTVPTNPTFPNSANVFKISGDGVFVSHDGGITYDNGYDANSGTAILSLLYAQGLTSDWIKTGTLDVGGVNNTQGIIHVLNEKYYGGGTWDTQTGGITQHPYWYGNRIGYTWLKPEGNYTITKVKIKNIITPASYDAIWRVDISYNHGTTWTLGVASGQALEGDNIINYPIKITATDDVIYRVALEQDNVAHNSTFTYEIYTTAVNTVIDDNGIETNNLHVTGGSISIGKDGNNNPKFYVDSNGNLTTRSINALEGTISGLTIDTIEKGWHFNDKISGTDHFFKISAWGGITCGTLSPDVNSWVRLDYVTEWGLLKVDYAGHQWGGIVVTNAGSNSYATWGDHYIQILNQKIVRYNNGSVMYASWTSTDDTSDKRLKTNVKPLNHKVLQKIFDDLEPIIFNYIEETGIEGTHFGVFAQDMQKALEDAGVDDSRIVSEDENGYKHLAYHDTIPLTLGAVKDLYGIVEKQQEEIDLLKQEIALLKEKVGG